MRQPIARFLSGILLIAGLSACATVHQNSAAPLSLRSYHEQIELSGRLSANYEANYREQSISVHFNWTQTRDQTLISLSSPTGQTVATILINADGAELTRSGEPTQFAPTVDQLSTDLLGWPLPVAGLRDWLQGFLTAQHRTALTAASATQPFTVDGWQLNYTSWQTEGTLERPKRLDLSRQTGPAGPVALRIVLDQWSTP